MSTYKILVIFLFIFGIAKGQTDQEFVFDWAHSISGPEVEIKTIGEDNNGDMYLICEKNSNVVLDISPDPNVNDSLIFNSGCAYIVKFDAERNHLWHKTVTTSNSFYSDLIDSEIDSEGNSYVAVAINSNGNSYIETSPNDTIPISGSALIKYNKNGNYLWHKSYPDIESIAVDNNSNVIISIVSQYLILDPDSESAIDTSSCDHSIYTIKLDSSGVYQTSQEVACINGEVGELELKVDNINNIYLKGASTDSIRFNPNVNSSEWFTVNYTETRENFFLKLNTNLEYVWDKKLSYNDSNSCARIESFITSEEDYIYMTGAIKGAFDMDPNSTSYIISSSIDTVQKWSSFITKLDLDGNHIWSHLIDLPSWDAGIKIAESNSGNITIAGLFANLDSMMQNQSITVDFDPSENTNYGYTSDHGNSFFYTVSSSGEYLTAFSFEASNIQYGTNLYYDSEDYLYATGSFDSIQDFNPSLAPEDTFFLPPSPLVSSRYSYIVHLKTCTSINNSISQFGDQLSVPQQSGATYQWFNCDNNTPIAGATSYQFTPTQEGNYAVEISINDCDKFSICQSVNNIDLDDILFENLNIIPNPTSGKLTINYGTIINSGKLTLWNVLGEKCYQQSISNTESQIIDIAHLPSGAYHIEVSTSNRKSIAKVIKN